MQRVPVDLAGGGFPCRVCIVETKGALAGRLHRRPFWRIQVKLRVLVSMVVEDNSVSRTVSAKFIAYTEGDQWNGNHDETAIVYLLGGRKKGEKKYKDGYLMSASGGKPNGHQCPESEVWDGNGVMVWYKDDGTEDRRLTYKDDELIEE
jgi:hypothetical protein